MIAAAFLVLLRPLSLQCVLLLILLLLGTVATILFLCCWHRRLRHEKIPIKSVFSRRSRSREAGLRTHHFRSEVFRHSPRHGRRGVRARVCEERPVLDPAESEPESCSAVRKRKVTKRVQPEFYHSVQVTPTRRPVGVRFPFLSQSSGSGNASLRCSMSSSADFSDEDDYSVRSGCVSPAPGDTLPWNLPRHERSKRKIHGGSVLDPAERAVLRIADERDRVQKKTFTKWINQHLLKVGLYLLKVRKHVNDLYEDLRDGHNLISLLEVLSGDKLPRERNFLKTLRLVSSAEACTVEQHGRVQEDDGDDDDDEDKGPREKGRMRFHRLQNVQIALDYLKRRQVKLVNIRNDDITDGNPKLTLGLIWTIILHFQIFPSREFEEGQSGMGNVFGCVRGHKDDRYVDPSKAPLSPMPKELRGRRYFQRRKSRKSVEFQPGDIVTTQSEPEKNEQVCDPVNHGVYVGEVPVFIINRRTGIRPPERDRSFPTVEENIHKFTKSSKCIAPNDGILEKKLLQRQLRRAASFGAVEHLLRTLRGHGSRRSSSDHQWEDVRGLSRIICDTQVRRKRRRTYTSSGGSISHNSLDAFQKNSTSRNEREISDIHVTGESEDMTAKERLLLWSQQMTEGYVGVRCENFTTSWKDGRLFNAIIHKYRPDLVDMSKVSTQSSRSNLEQAFTVAEQLGVARLLDPEDVDVTTPDEKSVITYVSTLYDVFPKVPDGFEGISANDVDVKWVDYQNMVNYLSQWIKHNVSVMSDRNFPVNPVELKALYLQYLHFKESEIPLKENEKTKIKHLYKMLEVWIEFGRIHLPEGYHPNDVEKEWGKLIVAMLEREKSLRPEVDRLEMLQQIADRVKRDCVAGEDKLTLARASLQSDIKRFESGIQLQNEPEIAGYLLECENLLRQQVVDIQILLDGKFYLADQLVQRVSKLRDDLLTLRTECSSVYSKGRSLSTEQTKMMISGITQSLNSGFSQNLNVGLSPALTPGSGLSSSFTPALTPALTPGMTPALTPGITPGLPSALIPGLQPTLRIGGSMEPGMLQHMKHMQIRKPMLKASLVDPSLSEEEVNMKFVQDLLNWVEEMQVQLDQSEWGSDLPNVESHLENHRNVHRAIEDFQMSIKEAKMSEIQMTHPLKQSYSDKLGLLESQYGRLLNSTKERQKHLDSLHNFVSHATRELIWLNEKEEEEVAFDWSERNSNISRKKDYHSDLMRELDEKEGAIRSVQDQADVLLQQNHPARLTIEAYKAAMQTQWSWILQLCYCVEQHLKENVIYFEFFNDAKESMDYLKSLQDSIARKYGCDRTSSLHRLEDLIQESMDEKEQLLQYRSTVASLVGRAKSVVQLKPRNPENPLRSSLPVKSICDYRQIEITIYKDDECVLANNSHRAKWKVISPSGNEAMVPSVCFTVPPPNKEAVEMASRIEQLYQKVLALWHRSHVNMKSVVSWHYLMMDIRDIRKSTVASIKTMLPGEHQQVLSSLQSHFEEFLEDSEESEVFTVADCTQLEREVLASKEYYEELLKSAEREEHEESVYNMFISDVRNFRMRVEAHEEQLIRQVRSPLERDDLKAIMQRIIDQERKKAELDRLNEDLEVLKEKCEAFLRQAANSPSVPTLSSELNVLTQSMAQVYSMCSIYLEKLKTVSLAMKHSQSAEALVKLYEGKLCEEDAVTGDIRSIDAVMSTLKQWRSEIDERREIFHDLEDELQKARAISDRMFKTHNERDFDLDWHKEKAEQLGERWRNVHSQIENRLRDLEGVSKSLKYFRDAYNNLDEWSKEMEVNQLKTQENQPEDSKALAELLNQQKVLVAEIERKQTKIDECQKYSEQYSAGVKDYELQLMTYRAMVDSQHKSPVKRRRMQSSSDAIQQEFMDLRTRYTALVTLMTQYVKFASETLKRAEEDERRTSVDKAEYRSWFDSVELQKVASEEELSRLKRQVLELEASLSDRQQQLDILGGELEMQKKCIEELNVQKTKAEYEAQQYRVELEGAVRAKAAFEQELKNSRQIIQQAEARHLSLEESLRMLKKNTEESTLARRKLEDHLRRKDNDVQDLEEHSRSLERELKAKEGAEANLLNQIRKMEKDLPQMSNARLVYGESWKGVTQKSTISISAPETEALQFKVDELMMDKKKAETEIKTLKSEVNSVLMQKNMADEKAQRFKELLDDANNRLKKLQEEMDLDRNSTRQKSDELRQEASELRKSVYIFQEQVKSLQRDKSSLEHRVLFHKTEVDGLKEQLKISQGKLLQWSTNEQENCQKLRGLEEELSSKQAEGEQIKFKMNELNRINQLLEGEIRHLTVSIESFQQEKSHFEQRIKSLKNESENLKDQLQKTKEEVSIKSRIEKDLQLKVKNLELELQKCDLQVTQLTKKVEQQRRTISDSERSEKNLNAELDKANMDIGSKEQQISIFKSHAESAKSQLKIIEEELLKKTQTSHELQLKLRDYNEEVKKASEFQQKVKTLNVTITNYEAEIRNLKAELTSITVEKNLANQKVQEHKVELNNLNMALQKAKAETQKESTESKENLVKLRELDNELIRCRQTISRMSGTSEKATVNLKLDISTLQREKQAADQKLQALKTEFDQLNSTLKKTKNELLRVTQEGKINQSKINEMETELQKNRLVIREINSNSDKYTANLQQECSNLIKEKGTADEKVTTLKAEISQLKIKLDQTQEDLLQKQKETAAAKLRSQMLEDQLENCKRMLEDLKGKLELQKKGYETQIQLVQNEMEQKLALQESRMKLEFDRKSKERLQSTETFELDNKQLLQEIEKLKTLHLNAMKAKQEVQKQLDSMSTQLEQAKKQKGASDLELLKAKSKITELETEKIRVKSSMTQLDIIRKENSEETARLKQNLTETKQKLMMAENEAKTLKDKISSYIKEVKSLQEKNLKLDVTYTSEIKRLKELESANHQCAKDNELAKLKTELILTQKIVSSYEAAKQSLEDELKKMKMTSERSVEEERKEHGEKVSKLLDWMSDVKSDVNKNGKAVSDDRGSTESANKPQIPIEEVLSKKEQITEALRSTQQRLTKYSDKMSEEEKCEAENQLKLLQQAYNDLSEMSEDQTQCAEQEFEVIEGVLDVGKGAVLSVCRAVQNGLLDHCTGLSLLGAQLITSELILPEFHMCLDLEDAFRHNLVDEPMYEQLQDLNEAYKCIQSPRYAFEPLPAVAAMKDGAISERLAVKIVEIQLATGGLRVTLTGESLSLERAFEFGLIPNSLYIQILQRQNTWKDLIDPNTAEKVSLIQLVQRSIVHEETGLRLLAVKSKHDGSIAFTSGRDVSILRATHDGLIDRDTMIRLLSAQLFAGGIVDPRTSSKLTVEEAVSEGLIDEDTAGEILSYQAQHGGIVNPKSGARLTVDEAVQCDLISSRSALLVLERQKSFMGLLWPQSGEILTVSMSMQHEILTEKLAHELLCNRRKIVAFYIPENSEVVDIDSAADNGFINRCTVDFLKTIEIPDIFPAIEDLNDRFSSWLVMRELQIEGSDRSREGLDADEKSINAPSSMEAKQLFVSFLMMNSYMDPKSGQRLLIFDRQLNKLAQVLLGISETHTRDSSTDEDFPNDEHITHNDQLAVLHIEEPELRISEERVLERNRRVKTIESDGLIAGSGFRNQQESPPEPDPVRPSHSVLVQFLEEIQEISAEDPKTLVDDNVFRTDLSNKQETVSTTEEVKVRPRICSTQQYLECVGKLQDHYDALEDIRKDFLTQASLEAHIEGLQAQLEAAQSLEEQLAAFPGIFTSDLALAEQLLKSADELIPTQIQHDLASVFVDLQAAFTGVCHLSCERRNTILQAIDVAEANLEQTYQDLLSSVDKLSSGIQEKCQTLRKLDILNTDDLETVKHKIQQNKDLEKNLSGTRQNLDDAAFDVQNFISEHAQVLNPAQNRQMLKSLSATQRAFKELKDRVFTQRHTLDLHLEICEDEIQQQNAVEKQKEFVDKLQELCEDLKQTENRLIGHQQQSNNAKSVGDLQQFQQENQALQKDIQANVSALNEVISSTKKFLEENRSKLTPEQVAAIELKVEEVKSKANMLNQRAEETKKELEKVVTTVIKQETEKVAAVEQLEQTKNKIEVLLDWVSNIGKEKEMDGSAKENGNMPVDGKLTGREDDPNGNALDTTDNISQWSGEDTKELDIDQQYERLKAHHQAILSQQQDLIIATQSAQALMDKQADVLSPSEKEKLQKDIHDLRGRYEASLTQAEQQMKQMRSVQEELRKFQGDYEDFGVWLQQAQEQLEELGAPTGHLDVLQEKLQRQKSFYEDVICHKGDLRFITISGQKVLDVAKSCEVDTSGTCAAVKEKLDSTATRYKVMHTQCNQLGNNIKDVVDKYKKYEDATSGLLTWLNSSEAEARKQQSEAIAADPQTLQRQLEETKALQGQTTGHQVALETLRKTADALVTVEGDLLNNQDEIQEAVDDIVERYDNLSKAVSDRNEKLLVTLTRSLSVQDGLDEMMNWMKKVEENVGEKSQVLLDSAVIADALSKEAALEQDMSSRQSSISTMKAKVKKFVETAEPVAAAALQEKMEGLAQRFDNACEKHKRKILQMEQLKDKVEQFEKTSEKVQEFVLRHSHALNEADGPGKNVNELSQLVQEINAEMAEHAKDMETLHALSKELSNSGPEGSTALIQGKMANLSNTFNTFKDTVKEKEEEVLSCQDQLGEFKAAAGVLMMWLEETKEQVPVVQPNCSEQVLGNDVKKVNCLLEEWTAKAPAVQNINSTGSALCTLISVLTSPAKARMHHKSGSSLSNGSGPGGPYLTNKELMLVQQNMSCISDDYSSLGELLKARSSELSALLLKVQGVQQESQSTLQWLENMKKTAVSWNSEPAGKDSVKMQMERQKTYEEKMHQKQQPYQELREKLLRLIEENPDSPEAEKWRNMLKQMDEGWEEVRGCVENRKQHLEESSRMLELFQTNQPQLLQWLQEKDLMMSVLGPLSVDPNMLNTQKQQVQILLKEFEGRKPQYEQLNEAALVISTASGNQDPTVEEVQKQLDAIMQKWRGLTSQLSERDALIEQAVGKTTRFHELLRHLGESATALEFQLNGQQSLSTQPDAVKKQLEATNAVLAELCKEQKRLKEAESLCSELSALVTEEYLRANLTAQLESVSKPFKMLEDKAGKRIQNLTSTFASSQEFHRTSKDFQSWLDQILKEQAEPHPVSTKEETLLQSLKELSAVQSALSQQEEPYNNILREAEALLHNTEGEEKLALQGQLSALRSNWEKVKQGASERAEKLNFAMERTRKYKEHAESLSTWLQECEDKKNKANFSVNPVEVENSLSQIKEIQRDVDKHRGQMELLNVAADSLLEVATADVGEVNEEKTVIGKNIDKLTEGLQLKKETLEKLSQRLKEFSEAHKDISDQIEGARKQLESQAGLGVQGFSNKNLTNMKSVQKNLECLQNQIDDLKSLAQSLVVDVPEVDGVIDLLLQADTLEKEHDSISKSTEEQCSTLENKMQGIGQFQDSTREMFTTFADLDDELDNMGPVSRDLKTLQDQQGTIQSFVKKLQDLMTNTTSAQNNCKKMLESEASPDLLGLKRDLEALSKQSGKLMDRAIGRKEQVEDTLKHLGEFYHKLDTVSKEIAGAKKKEESQGTVGMETDVINQQLEAFKFFHLFLEPDCWEWGCGYLVVTALDIGFEGRKFKSQVRQTVTSGPLSKALNSVAAQLYEWVTLGRDVCQMP
ncbi:dystonin [Silurus meridionalis]|nr:dystonin [Silurus meridionalis]